jgi:aspartate/tyrosine/aromatic aminotransferase
MTPEQVLFDSAYQGYSSGSLDTDAWALRHFVEQAILYFAREKLIIS